MHHHRTATSKPSTVTICGRIWSAYGHVSQKTWCGNAAPWLGPPGRTKAYRTQLITGVAMPATGASCPGSEPISAGLPTHTHRLLPQLTNCFPFPSCFFVWLVVLLASHVADRSTSVSVSAENCPLSPGGGEEYCPNYSFLLLLLPMSGFLKEECTSRLPIYEIRTLGFSWRLLQTLRRNESHSFLCQSVRGKGLNTNMMWWLIPHMAKVSKHGVMLSKAKDHHCHIRLYKAKWSNRMEKIGHIQKMMLFFSQYR